MDLRASSIAALVLVACTHAPESVDPVLHFAERVRTLVPGMLEGQGIPGAAIAIVDRSGLVWSGGFGTTGGDDPQPVDADTLFSIGSISKTFTATAVLMAVQDGALDLDLPITTWLPDFRVGTRFAPHPERRITLRQLLSHRAGLAHEAPLGNNYDGVEGDFAAHVASAARGWLRQPVDAGYAYSNIGIDTAALALERATDRPLAETIETRIFAPLGMTRSELDPAHVRAAKRRATGHGAYAPYPPTLPMLAAGGIYSSASDMARFLSFQLAEGKVGEQELLTAESLREMTTIPKPVSEFQNRGYGLGVAVARRRLGDHEVLLRGHDGGGIGFGSSANWAPQLGLGFVVLQNSEASQELLSAVKAAFLEALEALASDADLPEPRELPEVRCLERDATEPERFEGVYVGRFVTVVMAYHDGRLNLWGGGGPKPLCMISDDVAVVPDEGLADSYRLTLGDDGRPRRLVGLNSGSVYDYNDGPADPVARFPEAWRAWLGAYAYPIWGRHAGTLLVRERRGQLYLEDLRLEPGPEPGVFFAGPGYALDLREAASNWRGMALERDERKLAEMDRRAAVETAERFAAALGEGDIDGALAEIDPSHRSDAFGQAIDAAWRGIVGLYGAYAGPVHSEVWRLGDSVRVDLMGRFGSWHVLVRLGIDADRHIQSVLIGPRGSWWDHVPANTTQQSHSWEPSTSPLATARHSSTLPQASEPTALSKPFQNREQVGSRALRVGGFDQRQSVEVRDGLDRARSPQVVPVDTS